MNSYELVNKLADLTNKEISDGKALHKAAEKFSNRKVFGTYMIVNMRLKMYDADTRGVKWAEYTADDKPLSIEIVNA